MINTPELIKLAKQAGYGTQITLFMDGQREDIWGGSNETQKLEKFAELIVKECISVINQNREWPIVAIKNHFGVEE